MTIAKLKSETKENLGDMGSDRLILYHAGCWDGFCAAWLMHLVYPEARFIPVNYGDLPPDGAAVADINHIYVLDFCFSINDMLAMASDTETLTVIDHHESARPTIAMLRDEEGFPGIETRYDNEKSGARLTWEYICDTSHECSSSISLPTFIAHLDRTRSPWLVDYTEDRDLWRHLLPDSKSINAALRSYPLTFLLWDKLANRDPFYLIEEGRAIIRYKQKLIDQHTRFAKLARIGPFLVSAVNCTAGDLQSEVCEALAINDENKLGACWVDRGDGTQLWSLRSHGEFTVNDLAEIFGGGGHPKSAGFKCRVGIIPMEERA